MSCASDVRVLTVARRRVLQVEDATTDFNDLVSIEREIAEQRTDINVSRTQADADVAPSIRAVEHFTNSDRWREIAHVRSYIEGVTPASLAGARIQRLAVELNRFSHAACHDAFSGVRQVFRHSRDDKASHEVDRFADFDARPPEG